MNIIGDVVSAAGHLRDLTINGGRQMNSAMAELRLVWLSTYRCLVALAIVACVGGVLPSAAVAQVLTATPTALAFGEVSTGKTKDIAITLSASGADVNTIVTELPTGFSIVADGCGTTLLAGKSCTRTVRFAPTVATTYLGYLAITSNAPTITVDVSGTGKAAGGGTLSATPTSLAFGAVRTNTSRTMQIKLSATVANVVVGSTTAPDGFTTSHTCSPLIPVGGNCYVNVKFSPTTSASAEGVLVIESDAASSPLLIPLTGTGGSVQSADVPPQLALDLSSHDFGTVVAGDSKSFKFVLTNVGGQTLNNSITMAGQGFAIASSPCYAAGTVSIAPGASCDLSVRFMPGTSGSYTGSLTLSGVGSGDAIIRLTGRATGGVSGGVVNPFLTALSSSLDFGTVPTGSQTSRSVGLLASTTGVSITNISVPEGYAVSHDCDTKLSALGYCTVNVIFGPSAQRTYAGYLVLTTNSGNATFVSLAGSGGSGNSLTAASSGTPEARTLTAYYRFNDQYQSRTGNLYVALEYRGELYFLSGTSVTRYQEGIEPPAYASGTYQATDVTIFNAEDLRQFAGARVYLGFGNNLFEVLNNQQYALVYTLH